MGSLQSRGQPQTTGHRLLCGHPPRDLKTKVPLDSSPLELARLLALVFPSSSGRSGGENRSAGDPQSFGAAHRLRTLQRSAPKTRLASSSALSRGRPPTPTRTLVDLGAAPYNRSRCCSHAFRETTHSEGQCRWWRADYYTGRPKAESPLSQGPRPACVKIFYTPCVRVRTHHPNFLETYINQGK